MCLITKKGANQKTLLVCSELTLLARSSCSLRAEDVGKQYMLQRKITSVHSMGNKSVPLADSPRPGWEGWDILGGLHGGRVDDVNELRLQRSTTDQETINIGLCRQLFAVCTSHRASVDDPGRIGDLRADIDL